MGSYYSEARRVIEKSDHDEWPDGVADRHEENLDERRQVGTLGSYAHQDGHSHQPDQEPEDLASS